MVIGHSDFEGIQKLLYIYNNKFSKINKIYFIPQINCELDKILFKIDYFEIMFNNLCL